VPVEELPPGCAVFDLVYTRGETAWVTAARQAGHRATDGEGMLIEQGAIAFEQWFGIKPDRNAMWKAIH
jgi:shikimate dehydrogenase